MSTGKMLDRLLDEDEEDVLLSAFENTTLPILNDLREDGQEESRYFIFEIDVLEAYLRKIKREMSAMYIVKQGIRISLARYPEISDDTRINPLYLGRQTVFISPEDMDLGTVGTGNEVRYLSEKVQGIKSLNFGGICPPCPGT